MVLNQEMMDAIEKNNIVWLATATLRYMNLVNISMLQSIGLKVL